MADPDGNTPPSLIDRPGWSALLKDPHSQDFFAALRQLQAQPDLPAFGAALRPGDEPVRLRHEPALSFAPSSLTKAKWNPEKERLELFLRFTGLLGPNGPLPIHLTEYVIDRGRHHDDKTLEGFLNIFHHRIYSLFFRAWALNNPAVDQDRPDERRHQFYLRSLVGLGTEGTEGRDSVPDAARLFFSGWTGGLSRSPEGLAGILSDFLMVPVEVHNFQGAWLDLPTNSRCQLGQSRSTGVLGATCFSGERVWLSHLKFRLRFGPLQRYDYEKLLPGGSAFKQVTDWIRFYVGEEFSWEAQLVLLRPEVPPCALGRGTRLGYTSWLGEPAPDRDVDDLVVQAR
jgi:type VI secretion system protein ImpH